MNQPFTINDFNESQRERIKRALVRELDEWRRTSIWWRPSRRRELTETHWQMIHWCRAFMKFYTAVLVKKEPIDRAFCTWITEHEAVAYKQDTRVLLACLSDFDTAEYSRDLRVPHRQFLDAYSACRRQLQEAHTTETADQVVLQNQET